MKNPHEQEIISSSEQMTFTIGVKIAAALNPGDSIGLSGELGTGKTVITRGITEGLHSPDRVSSPTFTLMNIYRGGRMPVYHFDAYRLNTIVEFEDIGYKDYLYGDGVSIIEWCGKVQDLLPENTRFIHLEHINIDKRRIVYSGRSPVLTEGID